MSVVVSLTSVTRRKLQLYVAGETPATFRARAQCRVLLDEVLGIEIEETDVLTAPAAAEAAGIMATPTLSDEALSPPRRIVGDLSDVARVLQFLGLERPTT
jgi:circadian clock protein KaiB